MISFSCPSRGRPKFAERLVKTALETAKRDVEILFYLNDDDPTLEEYKELLSERLVKPTEMELYICNVDGSDLQKITSLGGANWAPFFHPSDKKIIFSSNHKSKRGFPFNLFMIDIDGENHNLPSFIFNKNSIPINDKHIYYALNFISNYIHKKILVPNNLFYPKYRNQLQSLYK